MRFLIFIWLKIASIIIFLTSCASGNNVPVVEREVTNSQQDVEAIGGKLIRIVKSGDTLYAIAFESGLDINYLAQWNGIDNVQSLSIGQTIRLTEPVDFVYEKKTLLTKETTGKVVSDVDDERKVKTIIEVPDLVDFSALNDVKKGKEVSLSRDSAQASTDAELLKVSQEQWYWPVVGNVIEYFSIVNGQQGVTIQSSLGSPVLAAKSGEVVYVGNGLKGYGNLIIINHDEHFLSAYAHNLKVFVTEGQMVAYKQKIGLVGEDNKQNKAIQFQIRIDGQPVDPLKYLPAK